MQIRAANRTRREADDGIRGLLKFGLGDAFEANVSYSMKDDSFHGDSPEEVDEKFVV